MKKFALALGIFAIFAGSAVAQEAPVTLTPEQVKELVPLRNSVQTIQDMAQAKVLTEEQAKVGTDHYLKLAAQVAGRQVSAQELLSVDAAPPKLTALQKFAGFVTFVNILWVFAIVIVVVSFCYLFGDLVKHLFEILANVPLWFYELVFYGLSLWTIFSADKYRPGVSHYVALTGCLLFAGALAFTCSRRQFKGTGFAYSLILAVLYSAVAVLYTSPMIGFVAVIALMGALGFSVIVSPLVYCIGFENEDSLGKATVAAFALLIAFSVVKIFGFQTAQVFQTGALWMGSFVGYLGLLIASSKWYKRNFPYVVMQFVTIAFGVAALFVGSVYQIGELQKIGGTFFALYVLEKFCEIPVESTRGYAVLGLTGGGLVYWFCMTVKSNPEAFRAYLLF
jgi:hypothetical protein